VLLRCLAIDKAVDEAHNRKRISGPPLVAASEAEAYRLLSAVHLRLGEPDKAGEAARQARLLEPMHPETYRQSAEVLLARQDGDAAAVTLMEGFLLTSDSGLRDDLISLYRSGLDTRGCAIANGPNGPAMNPACEMVHRHICTAAVGAIGTRMQKGQGDQAQAQQEMMIRDFNCPAGLFAKAIGNN